MFHSSGCKLHNHVAIYNYNKPLKCMGDFIVVQSSDHDITKLGSIII